MIDKTRQDIPENHPVRRLFLQLTERGLSQLNLHDRDTINYITNLLTEFVNIENMHRIKRRLQAEVGKEALLLSVTNGFLGYAPLREYYHRTPQPYSVAWVPYMLGWVPFTDNIEDEVLAAAVRSARAV